MVSSRLAALETACRVHAVGVGTAAGHAPVQVLVDGFRCVHRHGRLSTHLLRGVLTFFAAHKVSAVTPTLSSRHTAANAAASSSEGVTPHSKAPHSAHTKKSDGTCSVETISGSDAGDAFCASRPHGVGAAPIGHEQMSCSTTAS